MYASIFCIFYFYINFQIILSLKIPFTMKTKLGRLTGVRYMEVYTNSTMYEFRKIPYGRPPVGKLRFRQSLRYGKWLGIYDATSFGPSCYQDIQSSKILHLPNKDVSENCLFLNIHVPHNVSSSNKYPVMVWVHGGGFDSGQGMSFNGGIIASLGNVIVVTLNYRLGVFGFLSTGDTQSRGNYGLLDQMLAIKWIHKYIRDFGGDPTSITLFGHSSGAMSISFLSLSNSGIFQKVILQSGFGTSPLAVAPNVVSNTVEIAKDVSCFRNESVSIECLRKAKTFDLQNAYKKLKKKNTNIMHPLFGPTTDIIKAFQNSSNFRKLKLLIGNVRNEGTVLLDSVNERKYEVKKDIQDTVLCDAVSKSLYRSSGLKDLICDRYRQLNTSMPPYVSAFELYGDVMFNYPTWSALQWHSQGNESEQSFQYILNADTKLLHVQALPSLIPRPIHGDDKYFVSPFAELMLISKPYESLAKTMMTYWTNFAKTGNVNGNGTMSWPEYTTEDQQYMELDLKSSVKTNLYESRMKFWAEDVPCYTPSSSRGVQTSMSVFVFLTLLIILC